MFSAGAQSYLSKQVPDEFCDLMSLHPWGSFPLNPHGFFSTDNAETWPVFLRFTGSKRETQGILARLIGEDVTADEEPVLRTRIGTSPLCGSFGCKNFGACPKPPLLFWVEFP